MKVLWTFDPFEKNQKLHTFGKNLLLKLFDKTDSIEAVYVASNAEVQLATAFNIPANRRYSSYPKGLIKSEIKKLGLKKINVEVLFEKSLSLTSTVKNIIDYTKKNKTDLMLISTNSKEFLPRMVFGSFAETLIHMAVCDLLIFHQKSKFSRAPKNILYAHDFSPKGSLGLERVVEYAKKWNSELFIVYAPIPEAGVSEREFRSTVEKNTMKLKKALKSQNIEAQIHLEFRIMPVSDIILEYAKKSGADIIALTAQSNKLNAFLGGSITRQVIRTSELPTLVLKV